MNSGAKSIQKGAGIFVNTCREHSWHEVFCNVMDLRRIKRYEEIILYNILETVKTFYEFRTETVLTKSHRKFMSLKENICLPFIPYIDKFNV